MRNNKPFLFLALISFFLSGISALGYQILCVRLISLFFGHTTLAISSVIAIFMAGLAAGSLLAAKYLKTLNRAQIAKVFVSLQAGIALFISASKPLIYLSNSLVMKLGINSLPPFVEYPAWFAISFLILIIPTTLMGATLPLLTGLVTERRDEIAGKVSLLYGANTLGAVVGTAVYGFFLINLIGISKSLLMCSAFNVMSGLAMLATFFMSPGGKEEASSGNALAPDESNSPSDMRLPLAILALSGFAGMACELAWTRLFASLIGSSTYAFSIVLMTFLLGLSLGSFFFDIINKRINITITGLSILQASISVMIIVFIPLFNYIPYFFVRLAPNIYGNYALFFGTEFVICFAIMFLPTLFMGISFPWAVHIARNAQNSGAVTGVCYGANTLGSIAGSIISGFFWIPAIGTENTLVSAAIIYFISSMAAWLLQTNRAAIAATVIIPVALIFLAPRIDPYSVSSGMFMYADKSNPGVSHKVFYDTLRKYPIIFHKEGISSTVTVMNDRYDNKFLRINGKTDASTSADMPTQLMAGYIPCLIFPQKPVSALTVGLGSGVTLSAIAAFDSITKIDCVEIEPAVKNAAEYFALFNRNVIKDKRLSIIYTDARHYYSSGRGRYDIIVSEPSNPWISGIANLYTREAFELAKNMLAPNGVFCQWFQAYSMSERDFKAIAATFLSVYPDAILAHAYGNDYLLLGSTGKLRTDYEMLKYKFGSNEIIKSDMANMGYNTPEILLAKCFLLEGAQLREYAGSAPVQYDDKPTLEFSAPLNLHSSDDNISANLEAIRKYFLPEVLTGYNPSNLELADMYNALGTIYLRDKNPSKAEYFTKKALEAIPNDPASLVNIGRIYNLKYQHLQAEEAFKKAISLNPKYPLSYFHLAMLYLDQNMTDKATASFAKGLKVSPGDPMASIKLAEIYSKTGSIEDAKNVLKTALARPISSVSLRLELQNRLKQLSK